MQLASDFAYTTNRPPGLPLRELSATIVLVDPQPREASSWRRVLSGENCRVVCAESSAEVFSLDPESSPGVVVLSDQVGYSSLLAVAEYARHRWPAAWILVLGQHPHALDPGLYDQWVDDLTESACVPEVIERHL